MGNFHYIYISPYDAQTDLSSPCVWPESSDSVNDRLFKLLVSWPVVVTTQK